MGYFTFLASSLFRKWSFYFSILMYLLIETLLLFLLPVLTNDNIPEILFYNGLWMLLLFMGAITASIIAIQLFRAGIDDGSELLIISKPISRARIVWSKIILMVLVILMVSVIAMIIGFISAATKASSGLYQYIGAGMFLGTLVGYFFFSAVTVLSTLYLKKVGSVLISIGSAAVLMLYALIISLVSTSPTAYLKNDNYSIKATAVVKASDSNSSSSSTLNDSLTNLRYYWGGYGTYNNKPITLLSKNKNDLPLISNPNDTENYLTNLWNKAASYSNNEGFNYSNLMFQLASLFNLTTKEYYNQSLSSFNFLFSYTNNFPFTVEVKNFHQNFLASTQDLRNSGYVTFDVSNVPYYILHELTMQQIVNNPKLDPLKLVNQNLLLATNQYARIYINNKIISYEGQAFNNPQWAENHQLKVIALPTVIPNWSNLTQSSIIWPQEEYLIYNYTNPQSLERFINNYFNNALISSFLIYTKYFGNSQNNNVLSQYKNPYEFMSMLFSSMFFMRTLYNPLTQSYTNFQGLSLYEQNQIFDQFAQVWYNFQFLSLAYLNYVGQNSAYNFNYAKDETINKVLSIFGFSQSNTVKNNISFLFTGDPKQFINFFLPNASSTDKLIAQRKIVPLQSNLFLINPQMLTTFAYVKPASFFNLGGLISAWLIISILFLAFAFILYAKRDFS